MRGRGNYIKERNLKEQKKKNWSNCNKSNRTEFEVNINVSGKLNSIH